MKRTARLVTVLVICLIVGSLVLAGCTAPAPMPAPTATPTPKPTLTATPTPTPTAKLPAQLAVTVNNVGSLQYSQVVGLSQAIETATGMKTRAEPYSSEVARLIPMRAKEVELGMAGAETIGAVSQGLRDTPFADWGPQKVRMVWRGDLFGIGMCVRTDSPIKTYSDLKGKRLPWTPGGYSQNGSTIAWLAFAGLTDADITKVEMSFPEQPQAFINGKIDAAAPAMSSASAQQLVAMPGGIRWLNLPVADKAGWERLTKIQPVYVPLRLTTGPGITAANPVETCGFPMAVICYDFVDENLIYAVTKALWDGYDIYKGAHPTLVGWTHTVALDMGAVIVPYHPGTIKALKEKGAWDAQHESFQQQLLAQEQARFQKK